VVCKSCADDAACGDVSQTTTFRCWITAKCFVRSFVLSFFLSFFLSFALFLCSYYWERVRKTSHCWYRGPCTARLKRDRHPISVSDQNTGSENCTVAFLLKPLMRARARAQEREREREREREKERAKKRKSRCSKKMPMLMPDLKAFRSLLTS